jgi:metal-sulfur cluster biosynthetic enzyme
MIKQAVEQVPEVGTAEVDIRWETSWATERLSESARRKLRFLPPPNVATDPQAFAGRVSSTNGATS